jgi:hypothetical protein
MEKVRLMMCVVGVPPGERGGDGLGDLVGSDK